MLEKLLSKVLPVGYIPGQKWIAAGLVLGITAGLRALNVDLSAFGIPNSDIQIAAIFVAHYLWPETPSVRL